MSASTEVEPLHSALEPLALIQSECSQVACWVDESFAAIEAIQAELAEWQIDLEAQQAALAEKAKAAGGEEAQASRLQQELEVLRKEIKLWESEGQEQIDALEKYEQREAELSQELESARQTSASLLVDLEAERQRANIERDAWMTELRELRRVLMAKWEGERAASREKLANSSGGDPTSGGQRKGGATSSSSDAADEGAVIPSRLAAALRLRAEQRRQARERSIDEP